MYLYDETELITLRDQINSDRLVAGIIYLDNYEEAMESVEEVRRSLLTAMIDRKIVRYFDGMRAIIRKLEKDKYFIVLQKKHLQTLEERQFDILEQVKMVNIGNEMRVTLSIGIGDGGDDYAECAELARQAMDMALGRGGDQAVVKKPDSVQYYGGKSNSKEKTTRVKARVKAHAFRELIENKDRLFIMGHKRMDIDCLGAAIGIWRIAVTLDKKAHIVVSDQVAAVKPMLKRFQGGEYPPDLFISEDTALELLDENSVLVVVDTNNPLIVESPNLLEAAKTTVVLDHHRQSERSIRNAALSYVETYASSASEMVAEIVQYISDDVKIRVAEADAMYAGIVIDTHDFKNQTGVRTFEAAAFLRLPRPDLFDFFHRDAAFRRDGPDHLQHVGQFFRLPGRCVLRRFLLQLFCQVIQHFHPADGGKHRLLAAFPDDLRDLIPHQFLIPHGFHGFFLQNCPYYTPRDNGCQPMGAVVFLKGNDR